MFERFLERNNPKEGEDEDEDGAGGGSTDMARDSRNHKSSRRSRMRTRHTQV